MLWLMATVTVVVLMFGYHTSREGALTTAKPPAVVSGSGGTTSGGSGSAGSDGSDGSGSGSGAVGSAQPESGSTGTTGSSTVTGDTAQTQWGPVQVALKVANGKVTDVKVPVYPYNNPRDQEINSYALPVLVKETLAAQSADIDMVSGATVTSEGYLTSLQSALDKAGL